MKQFVVVGIFEGGITSDTEYGHFESKDKAKRKIEELIAQAQKIFVNGKAPNFKRYEIKEIVVEK